MTGWNWVFLTDIASFKPAILPEDNPADFNFFDTSWRCSCYIAPERFFDSRQADQMLSKGVLTAADPQLKSRDHSLPDMDFEASTGKFDSRDGYIFCWVRQNQSRVSKGLISGIILWKFNIISSPSSSGDIAELFNEGKSPFDLSEPLSYRNGDFDPSTTLSKIEDSNIRVGWNVKKIVMMIITFLRSGSFFSNPITLIKAYEINKYISPKLAKSPHVAYLIQLSVLRPNNLALFLVIMF